MRGVPETNPYRLKTPDELIDYVNKAGFPPRFKNSVPGFSVEEKTVPAHWWSDDPERDPLSRSRRKTDPKDIKIEIERKERVI